MLNRTCQSRVEWEVLNVLPPPLDLWLDKQNISLGNRHSSRQPPLACEAPETEIETDETRVVLWKKKKKRSKAAKF